MYPRVVAGTETPRHLSPSTSGHCKLKATGLNCYRYWRQLVSAVLNLPDLLLYWVGKLLQFQPTLDLSWYHSLILPSWMRPDTPHTQQTILWRVLVCGLWCFCITHCSSKTRLIIDDTTAAQLCVKIHFSHSFVNIKNILLAPFTNIFYWNWWYYWLPKSV